MTKSHHRVHSSETVAAYFVRRRLTTLGFEEDLTTPLKEALRQPDVLIRLARYGLLSEELMCRILHDIQAIGAALHAFATMPPRNEPRSTIRHIFCQQNLPDHIQGAERAEQLRLCPVAHVRDVVDEGQMMLQFASAAPTLHADAVVMLDAADAEFILRRMRILEHNPAALEEIVRHQDSTLQSDGLN